MNKKLFSWKALAGLALLVAMGLTSCKSGNEVDPETGTTTKPTTPGVIKGDADLTIRVVKPSDFNTQFNSWIGGLSADDLKAKVTDKKSFTIDVETSSMKLAADAKVADLTMTLPAQLSGKTVTINLMNGFAEKKNTLYFNVTTNNDKVVTINLPADEFDFDLTNADAIVDLGGSATISRFTMANAAGAQKPITIGSGLTIFDYASAAPTNYIKVDGTIEALEVAVAPVILQDKGVAVDGSVPNWNPYRVKSFIATADMVIDAQGYKGGEIETLYVDGGVTVTLTNTAGSDNGKNNQLPYVEEIVGLGAGAAVDFDDEDGLTNVDAIIGAAADKQITITQTTTNRLVIYDDIFLNATVTAGWIGVYGPSSISDVTLNGYVDVAAPGPVSTFTFDGVAFAAGTQVDVWKVMNLTPILDANGDQVTRDGYRYLTDITTGTWSGYVKYSEIPASILEVDPTGSRGYWYKAYSIPLYEETTDDFDLTFAFDGCKYNGKDLIVDGLETVAAPTFGWSDVITLDLNSKSYRWARSYDKDKSAWINILVTK